MINRPREVYLINVCRILLVNMPQEAEGKPKIKTQIIINRITSVAKNLDEYKFMIDMFTRMVKETRCKEVEVHQNGKFVKKEELKSFLKNTGLQFNNQIKKD